MPPAGASKPGLERALGLWGTSAVVVGTIIGSGIFLVANDMTAGMGTPAGVFFIWILGGALSLTGALAYAELGAMLPEAGGEYVYLREAYGPLWGFLYGWMQFLVGKPGSLATLGAGFALYFTFFFPQLNLRWVAFSIIVVLGIVNYFGVRTSGAVQTFFTVLKVGLILGLAFAGLFSGRGDWSHFATSIPVKSALSGLVAALVGALWAYDGWNNITMLGGEVARPERNLPLALVVGTAIVGALYLLANVAYFYILPAAEVAASSRVAADVAKRFLGQYGGGTVAVAAMVSIFAAINGSILSGSRVPYAMSADGMFFRRLAEIHPRYHSPTYSVVALCAIAAALSLSGTYSQLYTYVIFASWIFYGMTAASVLALRRKRPDWPRPYKAWGYPVLPAIFVLLAAALSLSILAQNFWQSLVGLLIIAGGVPAYHYWRRKKVAASAVFVLVLMGSAGISAEARPVVLVFALNDAAGLASLGGLAENGRRVSVLSPQCFVAHADGKLSGELNPALLERARAARIPLMPAVVNRDFATPSLEALLGSAKARRRLVRELVETGRRLRLRGFVIDFEGLGRNRRRQYSEFLGEARARFHKQGLSLGVAIPPPLGNNRDAFDYRAIGRKADLVILMAYDQHARFSRPGPIAAYGWVETALRETLHLVPREKILLGVAFYHRNWSESEATTGGYPEALALLRKYGAEMRWDADARVPWFSFLNGGVVHTVWLEDARSLAEKVELARRYRLGGVAAWRLGQEDPEVWGVLGKYAGM